MFAFSLLSAATLASATEHAPAFFWSPQAFGAQAGQREHLGEATTADLEHTVSALVGKRASGEGAPLFAGRPATPPEVQLVFLAEGLQTAAVKEHGARLPALKGLLEKSASSLSVPFTVQTQQRLFESAPRVAAAEAEAYFKKHATVFTNGVPDVVVVELRAAAHSSTEQVLAAHDALVGRIARAVDAGTRGNYAALMTADVSGRGMRRLAISKPVSYLHTTPTLLTAQLICLTLIVIFLSGFCCLFSLQTPKKFEEPKAA